MTGTWSLAEDDAGKPQDPRLARFDPYARLVNTSTKKLPRGNFHSFRSRGSSGRLVAGIEARIHRLSLCFAFRERAAQGPGMEV